MRLSEHLDALTTRASTTPGVTSLIYFGSAASAHSDRRDEWSDVDFNLFTAPGAEDVGRTWPFLPFPERIVLGAREYGAGGVVLHDDGVLYEFGAGAPWVVRDPDRDVVLDGGDIEIGSPPVPDTPGNAVRLFLAKTYIGMGRVRRGERVSGQTIIRTYALSCLADALRGRLAPDGPRSPFDPLRRLEFALPEVGGRIAALLDRDVEACARGLFELSREVLEPGWADYPSAGADVIASRLGWG